MVINSYYGWPEISGADRKDFEKIWASFSSNVASLRGESLPYVFRSAIASIW